MRKSYSIFKKSILMLALSLTAITAQASEDGYYWFYTQAQTHPTGAGKVYISEYSSEEPDYAESSEVKTYQGYDGFYPYLYAQPADGWLFAGWSMDKESVLDYANPSEASQVVYATMEKTDSEDQPNYPLEPDAIFYGVFSHVIVSYLPGQTTMGTIGATPLVNNIGDDVTLTATPVNENVTFQKWVCGDKEYTDATLTVKASEAANYQARFVSPYAKDVELTPDKYLLFGDSEYGWTTDSKVKSYYFTTDQLYGDQLLLTDGNYSMYGTISTQGYLITGEGLHTLVSDAMNPIVYDDSEETYEVEEDEGYDDWGDDTGDDTGDDSDDYDYQEAEVILLPAAVGGTDISQLPADHKYYQFDGEKFVATTNAQIPQGEAYLAIPTDKNTGDIITLTQGEYDYDSGKYFPSGIKSVWSQALSQGIYNLAGQRIQKMQRGINIVNGKKILSK